MPERYIGRTIGRFRIDTLVGSGGFAWVYRGYDPQLDIPVAVKILKPQFAGDDTFESRFRREASIAARLRHPHIIRILDVGQDADAVYFVMDYIPHGLVERLRIMETLPPSLLIRLGMDVASALAFAHREGVIHRDIKADNVLFDEHGNAIVADFGIARAMTSLVEQTGTNMVVGTPQYFSPEQARGLPLDGRSDLYSLGVTLFRAATSRLPFEGQDWYEIARQHVEQPPPAPRSLNPALPAALEMVILRLMAKAPDDRYPCAEALHEELAAIAAAPTAPDITPTVEVPQLAVAAAGRPIVPGPVPGQSDRSARRSAVVRRPGRLVAGALAVGSIAVAVALARPRGATTATARVATALARDGATAQPRSLLSSSTPGIRTPGVPAGADADDSAHNAAARRASTARADSPGRRSSLPRPLLRVEAPRGASLLVNGTEVRRREDRTAWSTDTLPPGVYHLTAALPRARTIVGCRTAVDTQIVTLRAGRVSAHLQPRPCGYLVIRARPDSAQFEVTSIPASGRPTVGRTTVAPQGTWVTLPIGPYRLRVSHRGCGPFETQPITIAPFTSTIKYVRLGCT